MIRVTFRALFVLAVFSASVSLLKAERYLLHVEEEGTKFDEEIDIDDKKEVETFKVPRHNKVVGADFMNDFKIGLTATKIPAEKACYISKLIPRTPRATKLKEDLDRASLLKSGKLPVNVVNLKWLVQGDVDRRTLPQSFRNFCGNLPMYKTSLISDNSTEQGGSSNALGLQVLREKRQTKVVKFRFCSKRDPLKYVRNKCDGNDVGVWDIKCKFKTTACFYFVKCINTAPAKDWVCQETHTLNVHTQCCDYVCP